MPGSHCDSGLQQPAVSLPPASPCCLKNFSPSTGPSLLSSNSNKLPKHAQNVVKSWLKLHIPILSVFLVFTSFQRREIGTSFTVQGLHSFLRSCQNCPRNATSNTPSFLLSILFYSILQCFPTSSCKPTSKALAEATAAVSSLLGVNFLFNFCRCDKMHGTNNLEEGRIYLASQADIFSV